MLNLNMKCWNSVRNAESHHWMHKVREEFYSTCADRSSENLCSSSGWRRSGKKKDRVKLRKPSNGWFSQFHPPLNANVLFCRFFFWISPCVMTKLRVLFSWLYEYLYCLNMVWFLSFFSSKYANFVLFFPKKKNPPLYTLQRNFYFNFFGLPLCEISPRKMH